MEEGGADTLSWLSKKNLPMAHVIGAVSKQGFTITEEKLWSHIYISPTAMAQLDKAYVKHYQGKDFKDFALLSCFKMMGPSIESSKV